MIVLGSYAFNSIYGSIVNPFTEQYEYFYILQDSILDVYSIRKSDNDVSLYIKQEIDIGKQIVNLVSFKNFSYLWFFVILKDKSIKELKFELKSKRLLHIVDISDLIDDIIISSIERNNTVHIFSVEEHKNILFKRQVLYDLNSSAYYITEKSSYAVLPDIYEFKFDKVNLIVNFDLKQYL